jgi:hypothetical protein
MVANVAGPIWGLTPKVTGTVIQPADTTTPKSICVAGSNGARVIGINAVTDDTAANDVNLYIQVGGSGSNYNIGGKRVAIASGNVVASTIASVNLLDAVQMPGAILADGSIQLGPNDVLKAGVVATVTAAKTLTIVVESTDY